VLLDIAAPIKVGIQNAISVVEDTTHSFVPIQTLMISVAAPVVFYAGVLKMVV
jgi:hypothetical protein